VRDQKLDLTSFKGTHFLLKVLTPNNDLYIRLK
jgi:hypothetical protein